MTVTFAKNYSGQLFEEIAQSFNKFKYNGDLFFLRLQQELIVLELSLKKQTDTFWYFNMIIWQ